MHSKRLLSRLHPSYAIGRIAVASAAGVLGALLLSLRYPPVIAGLGGWSVGGLALLAIAWVRIATLDAALTQDRAAREDPGRTVITALVVLTSSASLLAAVPLARVAKGIAPHESKLLVGLCLTAVALSWALTHTAFTLRYAHLYYREDEEGVGGIDFPGGARPRYSDFAYFAFTVGMCFQVSDTSVSSGQIRRTVLLHAVLSFVFNTAVLAFVLNLAFGLAG